MALIAIVLVGLVVLVGVALVLSMAGDGLPSDPLDQGDLGLPDRLLNADDVSRLRFRVGFRGYRMEDVDAALERVAQSMRVVPPTDR